ncbi:MAG: glycogen/starch synthase, partial [Candidatus Eisenbacteria bacterium]
MTEALRLALVASTCAPYARDAGRADVVAALADALARRGHDVALFLPAHRDLVVPGDATRETILARYPVPHGQTNEPASLIRVRRPGQPFDLFLVQHRGNRGFFAGPGFGATPASDEGRAERDAFFARAVLEALRRIDRRVDLVHAFDAPAAWTPAYLRRAYGDDAFYARTGSLFSVLDWNDAPTAPVATVTALGLDADAEEPRGGDGGGVPVLELALRHADRIVFPSTRFASEVREDEALAGPLSSVLAAREKDLLGIVPGIDARQWDPAGDLAIAARYQASDCSGKEACRAALAERCGWPHDPAESGWPWPIVGLIARLDDEKGLNVVRDALDGLLALDVRLAVLGR